MTVHSTSFQTDQPVPARPAPEALLPAAAAAAPQLHAERKLNLRKLLLTGAAIAALAGAAWYGWDYWTVGQFWSRPTTPMSRPTAPRSPRRSPAISATVLVGDNERVKAGQVLARIDDRDFKVALDQAKADVAAADATIANKQAAARRPAVRDRGGARPPSTSTRPTATFAAQDNKRYADLATTGYGSVQNAQQAHSRDRRGPAPRVARDTAHSRPRSSRSICSRPSSRRRKAALARAEARAAPGRAEPLLHHDRRARSTASSATARCASANTCRPARS